MKKAFILLVFTLAFPIFAQDVETENLPRRNSFQQPRDVRRQTIAEVKESKAIEEAVRDLSEEEKMYRSGRNKYRAGIIVFSVGCLYSTIPLFMMMGGGHDDYVAAMIIGVFAWPVGAGAISTGIPLTISGARKMSKYKDFKPTIAISPTAVKFAVEF